jgi:hypothetical protein
LKRGWATVGGFFPDLAWEDRNLQRPTVGRLTFPQRAPTHEPITPSKERLSFHATLDRPLHIPPANTRCPSAPRTIFSIYFWPFLILAKAAASTRTTRNITDQRSSFAIYSCSKTVYFAERVSALGRDYHRLWYPRSCYNLFDCRTQMN